MTSNDQERGRVARFAQLAQTTRDTPGGKLLRKFWHPVALSHKLPSGTPQPLRVLGEDLTLYRGESGKACLIAGRCAHRRTLLHTGWVQGDQLRCMYHGWMYDGTGQCTQRPGERDTGLPPVQVAGYPVREYCGLIFAYLGDGPIPAFDLPRKEALEAGGTVFARAEKWPCNWFQMIENSLDPTHLSFVHKKGQASYLSGIPEEIPQLSVKEIDFGLQLTNTRSNGHLRKTYWTFPNNNHVTVPGLKGDDPWMDLALWMVPHDDEHTTRFAIYRTPLAGGDSERYASYFKECEDYNPADHHDELFRGEYPEEPYVRLVSAQDYVALVGQRPVARREEERLGNSDSAIIAVRKIFWREMDAIQAGQSTKQWTKTSPSDSKVVIES